MRKLVYISEITNKRQIVSPSGEVATRIEAVQINHGWWCVSAMNNFQVGDKAVYFEIDSFIPDEERFGLDPAKTISYVYEASERTGWRIRTARMMGQYSQGYALPLHVLGVDGKVGDDLTADLGIVKWEPPLPTGSMNVKGYIPGVVVKTDQPRIENLALDIGNIVDKMYEQTIKLDGRSVSVIKMNDSTDVAGRNWVYKDCGANTEWNTIHTQKIDTALANYKGDIVLQGELIGPGIHGNHEKIKGHQFVIFEVQDLATRRKLNADERQEIIDWLRSQGAIIFTPPAKKVWIGETENPNADINIIVDKNDIGGTIAEILKHSDGPSMYNQANREGVVYKSYDDPNLSFKAISAWYLAKYGDR